MRIIDDSVDAKPAKRFFVEMLTRDISLEDAILDLLDNCVDGIIRTRNTNVVAAEAYEGFWARITFDENHFEIIDNCGGIPWNLKDFAFRMGRPEGADSEISRKMTTVGVYGIGMKRAVFKMGRRAEISTQTTENSYKVSIPADWTAQEETWRFDVKHMKRTWSENGTKIIIDHVIDSVQKRFHSESFLIDLIKKIETHYAVIIEKGFSVSVNGKVVKPKPISFRFSAGGLSKSSIRPYMFRSEKDGVDIFLAVGLREPVPGVEQLLTEQEGVSFSSDYAGWTIICNDRVVLYCNRDELTGWGTARIPRYHNQFISISGVVEFRGDPLKLPTTTTKRGLDFSSLLYQNVLDRMRDGLRMFIDFTNWWKAHEEDSRSIVSSVKSLEYKDTREKANVLKFNSVSAGLKGEQYKPSLPKPDTDSAIVRISYLRERNDVVIVGQNLIKDFDELSDRDTRRRVGEATFDAALDSFKNKPARKIKKKR